MLASFLPFILSFFLLPPPAFGEAYEWVSMGKEDIQVVSNPKIEAAFRLDLIDRAEFTIDIVTFDQRMDDKVGLPLLNKLAEAAKKGIKIRYAISSSMTPVTDTWNYVGHFLNKTALQYPNLEYLFAGGAGMMWKSGWGALDGIHEKLLIIDGKINFVTGRGHADNYLNWLDTAFIFKGPLVGQSNRAFEKLWATLQRELKVDMNKSTDPQSSQEEDKSEAMNDERPKLTLPFELSETEQTELSGLINWSKKPTTHQKDYRARLLHHDFLDQIRATGRKPSSISTQERLEILSDPIVDEVKNLLATAESMKYCTLATILNPNLKQCMLENLNDPDRSLQLSVFTNSKTGHACLSSMHLAAGWYAGLQDLDDLLKTGHATAYELKDETEKTLCSPLVWLHRKLILVAAGDKSTVIFGSHNLTYASSVALDEMSFEIESLDFYQKMHELFSSSLTAYGTEIQAPEIHKEKEASTFNQWLSSKFSLMY
jgi:phosphatidylserine/phosphatidylglycerophosphate/cardiolipin synthase-like enzyme